MCGSLVRIGGSVGIAREFAFAMVANSVLDCMAKWLIEWSEMRSGAWLRHGRTDSTSGPIFGEVEFS
jgi:hypothetical protein